MNPTISISGQTAVVTGGSRGIGAAIATKLAEMGAKTVILGRNHDALESVAGRDCSQAWQLPRPGLRSSK